MSETAEDSRLAQEVQFNLREGASRLLKTGADWEMDSKDLCDLIFVSKFLNRTLREMGKLAFFYMKNMYINRHYQNCEKQCAGREKYL